MKVDKEKIDEQKNQEINDYFRLIEAHMKKGNLESMPKWVEQFL